MQDIIEPSTIWNKFIIEPVSDVVLIAQSMLGPKLICRHQVEL
jgi:hypothetical protein